MASEFVEWGKTWTNINKEVLTELRRLMYLVCSLNEGFYVSYSFRALLKWFLCFAKQISH